LIKCPQNNKAPWAPSGFKVSLSLVKYGAKKSAFGNVSFAENPVMKVRVFSFAGGRIQTMPVE
jgi:hypothetical protein